MADLLYSQNKMSHLVSAGGMRTGDNGLVLAFLESPTLLIGPPPLLVIMIGLDDNDNVDDEEDEAFAVRRGVATGVRSVTTGAIVAGAFRGALGFGFAAVVVVVVAALAFGVVVFLPTLD